ncbi:hypothetical protein [Paeniglutamicibacter terrestris]|uniref:DUF1905 domain-containing protein n=1 Tax=Paeniglutamicibacter terrestris TaxID=2723403 RepID=A0ABX1G7H6_9MICC|nr:hypothetical protein [Paeniglutamicibacter terrestris]NKG22222.1 hypothetical protein [Paeniglutamicibacter terrestris]
MSKEFHARVTRASYEPARRPGMTEVVVQIPGEVDLSYGDNVVVVIPEGEVK